MKNIIFIFTTLILLNVSVIGFVYLYEENKTFKLQNKSIADYNQNYNEHYSKVATPDNLYKTFMERLKNKDKISLNKISCPEFPNISDPQYNINKFENWYESLTKLSFDNAKYETKFDSGYYFDIQNVIDNNVKVVKKFYYNEQNQSEKQKSYYCMEF